MAYAGDIAARGRALAEQLMTETVRAGLFKRTTVNGKAVRTLVTERYSGRAQYVSRTEVVSDATSASQDVATQSDIVKLPVSAPRLHRGDEIEVLTSDIDASLVGRVFSVEGSPQSGSVTAHRYPVKEQS